MRQLHAEPAAYSAHPAAPRQRGKSKHGAAVAAGIVGFLLGRWSGVEGPPAPQQATGVQALAQPAAESNGPSSADVDTSARTQPAAAYMRDAVEPTVATPAAVEPEPAAAFVYYPNCAAARAAGAAPIHAGDPGYASKLDRDGDGVACE